MIIFSQSINSQLLFSHGVVSVLKPGAEFQAQNTYFHKGKCTVYNQELPSEQEHMSMVKPGTQVTQDVRFNSGQWFSTFSSTNQLCSKPFPCCPSLDMFQPLNVLLAVQSPKLDTEFEMQPHLCPVWGGQSLPWSFFISET